LLFFQGMSGYRRWFAVVGDGSTSCKRETGVACRSILRFRSTVNSLLLEPIKVVEAERDALLDVESGQLSFIGPNMFPTDTKS
jgi:hypothetical protein